jgi:hypothetical protein
LFEFGFQFCYYNFCHFAATVFVIIVSQLQLALTGDDGLDDGTDRKLGFLDGYSKTEKLQNCKVAIAKQ